MLRYVDKVYPLKGKTILRPFYPGGDYEHAEYLDKGIVIDNPPFSIFTSIVRFYTIRGIPFFLFGPGLTIGSVFPFCTAVIVGKCNLPKYIYPTEALSISDFQTIAKGDCDFSISKGDAIVINKMDNGKSLFGNHLLARKVVARILP